MFSSTTLAHLTLTLVQIHCPFVLAFSGQVSAISPYGRLQTPILSDLYLPFPRPAGQGSGAGEKTCERGMATTKVSRAVSLPDMWSRSRWGTFVAGTPTDGLSWSMSLGHVARPHGYDGEIDERIHNRSAGLLLC